MISEMQSETQVIQLLTDLNDEFYQREVQTALMHHDECKRLLDEIKKRDKIINKLLVRRQVYRSPHPLSCECGECKFCDDLESIVGLLPERESGTVIPLKKRAVVG